MTKDEKMRITRDMSNDDLLDYFERYAKKDYFQSTPDERETMAILREEISVRISWDPHLRTGRNGRTLE